MLGLVLLAFRLALVLTSLTPCTALPSRSLRYFLLSSCRTNPLLAPNLARNLPLALIRDSISRGHVLFVHAPSPVEHDGKKVHVPTAVHCTPCTTLCPLPHASNQRRYSTMSLGCA